MSRLPSLQYFGGKGSPFPFRLYVACASAPVTPISYPAIGAILPRHQPIPEASKAEQ